MYCKEENIFIKLWLLLYVCVSETEYFNVCLFFSWSWRWFYILCKWWRRWDSTSEGNRWRYGVRGNCFSVLLPLCLPTVMAAQINSGPLVNVGVPLSPRSVRKCWCLYFLVKHMQTSQYKCLPRNSPAPLDLLVRNLYEGIISNRELDHGSNKTIYCIANAT